MLQADFYTWRTCFRRPLRAMYFSFIFCCHRHHVYTRVNWKLNRHYLAFCRMLYQASSKIVLSDDDEDV
jgi:hypothetical protein